ncbi:MAG: 3-phosphoshikimate 1-carboxyvinyltransferase, partial [Verrucomicrobia bacterium]|nr:3-phosphoshikimate 1-carboxyvinyltransferase [Verrucomicrobiota bacterium]
LEALETLGFRLIADAPNNTITVHGESGRIPIKNAELNVGNAGTAARFLPAFLALEAGGCYTLDGDPAMRERPIMGLLKALMECGAATFDFHGKPGHFPFTLHAKGFKGGAVAVDASASSQILSALLMAAPAGPANVQFIAPHVRPAYIAITLAVRQAFGADPVSADEVGAYLLHATEYTRPEDGLYTIEPDLSAASYFLALACLHGGHLQIPQLGPEPLQGDARFVEVLEALGLEVQKNATEWEVQIKAPAQFDALPEVIDFNSFSDTFLPLAALTPLLSKELTIKGIAHTRKQETDRPAGIASQLEKLGQSVSQQEDSLILKPNLDALRDRAREARAQQQLLEIDTYEDHRFAMSFAILGTYDLLNDGLPWLAIRNPACCGKTYPEFFQTLESLHHET